MGIFVARLTRSTPLMSIRPALARASRWFLVFLWRGNIERSCLIIKKKNTGLFEKKKEIENSVLFDNTYHIRSVTGTKNRLFAARTLRSGLSIVNIFCPAPSFIKSVLATHSLYTKIKKKTCWFSTNFMNIVYPLISYHQIRY